MTTLAPGHCRLVAEAVAIRPALVRHARRYAGSAAEDVVQDVCLRLLDGMQPAGQAPS